MQIDQLPCNVTNNCPADDTPISCKGQLSKVSVPKPLVFSYAEQKEFEYAYSTLNAKDFFVNNNTA